MKCSSVEYAYEKIKELIAQRKLLPGQQIVEMTMSKYCGLSRTPIREAIRILEREGLVEIIPNKGSFLRHITKDEVIMGYELDAALEGMANYLVADKVKKGEIEHRALRNLQLYIERMERFYKEDNMKEWITADEEFHDLLVELSGNTLLIEKRKQIELQLTQVLWFITPSIIDKRVSNLHHRSCLEAIREGNAQKAQEIASVHRLRVRDTLMTVL